MSPRTLERPAAGPDAPIDPRIRARRAEVARTAGRKRLRRLKVVLALVCAVVWTLVGLRSSLVDVDRVQVVGADHTDLAALDRAAATPVGTPMYQVDLAGIRRRLARLPWVDEVKASRLWPGTVRIVVTERRAVAAAPAPGGRRALLDAGGRVLEVVGSDPDLPVVESTVTSGPGERAGAAARGEVAVVAELPDTLAPAVTSVGTGPDGIELVLDDGFRVVVGDATDVEAKARSAVAVRQHPGDDEALCRIDVRVPSAPVLTGGRGCA